MPKNATVTLKNDQSMQVHAPRINSVLTPGRALRQWATTTLRWPFPVEKRWRRSENNACFIDLVPFLGQFMSNHRLKCLAEGLIVTKTSFHAGFWCLSRIKRSTRLPNRKTFGDVRHLWLPFSDFLGTCGLQLGAAHLWSETNFFRDSNPCGLHLRASNNPTNTVYDFYSAFYVINFR